MVFWPGQRALAEQTLEVAQAGFPLPGIPPSHQRVVGTIILAPTAAAFDSLARGAPAWSAAVAIPDQQVIIIPAYSGARTRFGEPLVTLRHELAHLALNAYLGPEIPRWFHEGYATWVSGGFNQEAAWKLRLAFLLGRAPPLDSLTLSWPRGEDRARLGYLLSASAVQYLATRSGEPAFAALLEAWREHGDFNSALRSTFLMTPGQVEEEWRGMVRRRYGWLLALSQTAVFWFALTVLFVIFGSFRRRHNRARMAALEAEEYMLPPAGGSGVDGEKWPE
ncbi:MAG TPA: hypothetical protein VFI91_10975 [Longimicrobiaceae bacterium]|nr:hypothetical protein [Longimicrobiaceae bacterium]